MAAKKQPLEFFAGDYRRIIVTTYQSGTTTKLNITGFNIKWRLCTSPRGEVIVEKTVGFGITIDPDQDANKGQWTLVLEEQDTMDLVGPAYYHEAVMDDGTGKPTVVMFGPVTINSSTA